MAAFDLQEQEQIAELKAWWAQWGKLVMAVIAAIVIGYLGSMGWKLWQKSQAGGAADAYAAVEKAFDAKDPLKTRAAADAMAADYASHALSARAMLLAAKAAHDGKDLAKARTALEWVAGNAKEEAIIDIARLRLSAVLLDQKQYDAALKAVDAPQAEGFAALFAEARGDALTLKGDAPAAKLAYQAALAKLGKEAPSRTLIETKLSALGV
ncbi:tetratricopeptide repeat protein [Chitinimonas arctica]|uniref:Tetratricopeptide repeat protein n=1 Tax=Chitinimonas arctica TaxID=2594795 RepID=A0A516SJH7_9NEIS|nr:tetratricopeptide repeat protein [Chitinimonas arctica]QDQ28198.1 tetratricopeptide repeat protein [Chitinimonas arctica]